VCRRRLQLDRSAPSLLLLQPVGNRSTMQSSTLQPTSQENYTDPWHKISATWRKYRMSERELLVWSASLLWWRYFLNSETWSLLKYPKTDWPQQPWRQPSSYSPPWEPQILLNRSVLSPVDCETIGSTQQFLIIGLLTTSTRFYTTGLVTIQYEICTSFSRVPPVSACIAHDMAKGQGC
jgi:hypothetical protein